MNTVPFMLLFLAHFGNENCSALCKCLLGPEPKLKLSGTETELWLLPNRIQTLTVVEPSRAQTIKVAFLALVGLYGLIARIQGLYTIALSSVHNI